MQTNEQILNDLAADENIKPAITSGTGQPVNPDPDDTDNRKDDENTNDTDTDNGEIDTAINPDEIRQTESEDDNQGALSEELDQENQRPA